MARVLSASSPGLPSAIHFQFMIVRPTGSTPRRWHVGVKVKRTAAV
jgi:hypothetical protein